MCVVVGCGVVCGGVYVVIFVKVVGELCGYVV